MDHLLGGVLWMIGDIVGADRDNGQAGIMIVPRELGQLIGKVDNERAMVAHEDDEQSLGILEIATGNGLAIHVKQ
jgi:hypothetical protein